MTCISLTTRQGRNRGGKEDIDAACLLRVGERRQALFQQRIDQFDALLGRRASACRFSSALVTMFSVARFRLLGPVGLQLPVEVTAGEVAVLVRVGPSPQPQDVAVELVEALGVRHPGGRP